MDGASLSSLDVSLYLDRPFTPPDPEVIAAIEHGPIDASLALPLGEAERLLDPMPIEPENGWCWLADRVGYVAVTTAMPGVTGEMLDWWFDWHPDDPIRYRIWHPLAHKGNSIERPSGPPRAKPHWDTVHHPVEDVGTGVAHARICWHAPSEIGFSTDGLDDPRVAAMFCAYAGDDTRHVRHTPMFHVALRADDGVVLRSRFWFGAALRPYGPLGEIGERGMNFAAVRKRLLPAALPHALANHCAEEYANLAALLPELYPRFGPHAGAGSRG